MTERRPELATLTPASTGDTQQVVVLQGPLNSPIVDGIIPNLSTEITLLQERNTALRELLQDTQETLKAMQQNMSTLHKQANHIQQQILAQLFVIHTQLNNP